MNNYIYKALALYWMSFLQSLNAMCSCNTESLAHGFIALSDDSVLYSQKFLLFFFFYYIYFAGDTVESPQNTKLVSNTKPSILAR